VLVQYLCMVGQGLHPHLRKLLRIVFVCFGSGCVGRVLLVLQAVSTCPARLLLLQFLHRLFHRCCTSCSAAGCQSEFLGSGCACSAHLLCVIWGSCGHLATGTLIVLSLCCAVCAILLLSVSPVVSFSVSSLMRLAALFCLDTATCWCDVH
jgi:hypothetical protein